MRTRNFKKPPGSTARYIVLSTLFCCVLLCISANTLFASTFIFSDLLQDEPAYPYVKYLSAKKLIQGYPDGTFRPVSPLTRAEMAALLVKAKDLKISNTLASPFKDVTSAHWACGAIEAAARAGLIKGYPGGAFRPEETVTRAQVSVMLLSLTKEPLPQIALPGQVKDIDTGHWAWRHVATALDAGIMSMIDRNSFRPDNPATRAQVARGLGRLRQSPRQLLRRF